MEGAYNVRDLGGYLTVDGRRTRWRMFLRAAGLHRLTPDDQDRLVQYGVRTVIDLRRTREVEESPNVFAASRRVSYHHQNLLGDDPLAETVSEPSERAGGQAQPASYTSPGGLMPGGIRCGWTRSRIGLATS